MGLSLLAFYLSRQAGFPITISNRSIAYSAKIQTFWSYDSSASQDNCRIDIGSMISVNGV
jgi:hypothetical protein